MLKRIVAVLVLAVALTAAGSPAARAGACLNDSQARQAVATGQALSLSTFYNAIDAKTGGGRPAVAQLCDAGGHFVWVVQVLTASGQQRRITVDALSGAIY